MEKANCRRSAFFNKGNDPFFPGRGETAETAIVKFCFGCQVIEQCDDYADRIGADVGVWGGKRRTRTSKQD